MDTVLHTLWGLAILALVLVMLAVLRTSAKPRPRICKCCGNPFEPIKLYGLTSNICPDCAADNILRDIERDEKLNDQEEPPRSELKYNVQGYR